LRYFERLTRETRDYTNNLYGPDLTGNSEGVTSKETMDTILSYFWIAEPEWRRTLPALRHEDLSLYVTRELYGAIGAVPSPYWRKVLTFLLAYHLYKLKEYPLVHKLVLECQDLRFSDMAKETFQSMYKEG
jgi:hypothetical protein